MLENCRLIPNQANDGDSFHVSAGEKEYLFRLYFVDAPETDEMAPRRLIEQAKYFGITVPQAIEVGRAAKDFTQEKLSQPFTVLTHMSDALGQSRLERFYAFVETKEGDLGEQLIRNGLARSRLQNRPAGTNQFANRSRKASAIRGRSETRQNRSVGHQRGTIERACTNAIGFQFFCCRWKDSLTLGTYGLACRFSSSCQTSRFDYAQQSSGENGSHAKEKTPLGNIDINTATEKELTTVPGIGHVMAARIIAARPFRSADDLKRVSGIGEKKYAQIRPYFQ